MFTVEKNPGIIPTLDCGGNWDISNPLNVAEFSAIAYVFGKYIQEILGTPVGLILSAWGNTPAEAWTDEATLKSKFKEIDTSVLKSDSVPFQSPSVLFNGMIHPILNYKIRGVIWSQGTNNRKRPTQYAQLFPAMIRSWREHWKLGDFPFYFVQNAPYSFRFDENTQSAFLREAQLKTMLSIPNTGMAVTMDVGDSLSNHPPEKITVGKRLAYWALAKTYSLEGLSYSGPVFKSMTIAKDKAILTFDYAQFGLTSFGKELKHFVIAGPDKLFFPAIAEISDTNLIVWNKNVKNPVAVRYCWENYAEGTLFNNAGLPASSFRTDNWDK